MLSYSLIIYLTYVFIIIVSIIGRITYSYKFKCIWDTKNYQILIKMLSDIILICNYTNVECFPFFGTLLGTIRHQNLIPWDDDADLVIAKDQLAQFEKLVIPYLKSLKYQIKFNHIYHFYQIYPPNLTWPYVDIFTFGVSNKNYKPLWFVNEMGSDRHKIPLQYIYPLREYRLGPLIVKGPRLAKKVLSIWYPNWDTECLSSSFSHRFTIPLPVFKTNQIKELLKIKCPI